MVARVHDPIYRPSDGVELADPGRHVRQLEAALEPGEDSGDEPEPDDGPAVGEFTEEQWALLPGNSR